MPPSAAAFRHVAGGSMSGAMGVKSDGGARGSSICNLRSAALSKRAAEILASVVTLAKFKQDRRLTRAFAYER